MQIVAVDQFRGLHLEEDPLELGYAGAVEMLNFEWAGSLGVLRRRERYTRWADYAGAHVIREMLTLSGGHVLAASQVSSAMEVNAFDADGVYVTYLPIAGSTGKRVGMCRWGADAFLVGNTLTPMRRYIPGTGFTTPTFATTTAAGNAALTPGASQFVAVTPWGRGRLVSIGWQDLVFSDPGDPLTFPTDNTVQVMQGDPESISGWAVFEDRLFVFKPHRFAVFSTPGVDAYGEPTFDYRVVDSGNVGAVVAEWAVGIQGPVVSTPEGVVFLTDRGLFVTRGGPARPFAPGLGYLFGPEWVGEAAQTRAYGTLQARAGAEAPQLLYQDGKLYLAATITRPAGPAVDAAPPTERVTFVYDMALREWTVFDWQGLGMVGTGRDGVLFAPGDETGLIQRCMPSGSLLDHQYEIGEDQRDVGSGGAPREVRALWRSGFARSEGERFVRRLGVEAAGANPPAPESGGTPRESYLIAALDAPEGQVAASRVTELVPGYGVATLQHGNRSYQGRRLGLRIQNYRDDDDVSEGVVAVHRVEQHALSEADSEVDHDPSA